MPEARTRRGLRAFATGLIVAGILIVVVPGGYALYGNWRARLDQAGAVADWPPAPIETAGGQSQPDQTGPLDPSLADPGWPWRIEIPKIGVRWLVYEGAGVRELRQHGVGHIEWTRLPWEKGTVGIAGHRTTYGAPFFNLHRLAPGDVIRVSTAARTFTYSVTERVRARPREGQILAALPETRRLALVACDPPFSARFRLVVFARFVDVTATDAAGEGR